MAASARPRDLLQVDLSKYFGESWWANGRSDCLLVNRFPPDTRMFPQRLTAKSVEARYYFRVCEGFETLEIELKLKTSFLTFFLRGSIRIALKYRLLK